MANHTLEITHRGSGRPNTYRVVPGHCQVESSDSVTWNAQDTDAVLFFPNRALFGRRDVEVSAGNSQTLTVNDGIPSGRYPYAIYCAKAKDFAEGGSHPVMIVRG